MIRRALALLLIFKKILYNIYVIRKEVNIKMKTIGKYIRFDNQTELDNTLGYNSREVNTFPAYFELVEVIGYDGMIQHRYYKPVSKRYVEKYVRDEIDRLDARYDELRDFVGDEWHEAGKYMFL